MDDDEPRILESLDRQHRATILLILSFAVGSCAEASEPRDGRKPQRGQSADEWQRPAEIDEDIAVQRSYVGGNTKQQYFLMRHRKPAQPVDKYGLVVIVGTNCPRWAGHRGFLAVRRQCLDPACDPR